MAPTSKSRPKRKRGVILLLVVSLLALFILIGVTYAILATNYLTASKIGVRIEEYGDLPEKEFDLILGQLLYDTSARSALRFHSLLGDLYGNDLFMGQVDTGSPGTPTQPNGSQWGGQAFGFQFQATTGFTANVTIDYYAGRVITFTSGTCNGHSTRILQYDPGDLTAMNPIYPQLYIETIESKQFAILTPADNDTFVINGAPFNGPGAGYDYNQYGNQNMEAVYGDFRSVSELQMTPTDYIPPPVTDLVAMLPHFNGFDPTAGRVYLNPAGYATMAPGGSQALNVDTYLFATHHDETWDAVDFQNMFLSMVLPTAAQANTDPTITNVPILPSYHRPELVNYWVQYILNNILIPAPYDPMDPADVDTMYQIMAQPYGADGQRGTVAAPGDDPISTMSPLVTYDMLDRIYSITRGCIFRPMPWDHRNFTGSNSSLVGSFDASFNLTNGQALFNVLCGYDVTGSTANLNLWDVDNDNDGVADSIWIDPGLPVVTATDGRRYKRMVSILVKDMDGRIDLNAHGNLGQITDAHRAETAVAAQFGLAAPGPTQFLPRGTGFGPAEVCFLNLFGNDKTVYENLLRGRYGSNLSGPGPTADSGNTAAPGMPNSRDGLNIVKHHGVPNQYPTLGGWYASPPDVWGRAALVLDYGGQPLSVNSGAAGEMLDNPYEISLSGELNNGDSPYTLVEMERLLRYHDRDAQYLPCRPGLAASGFLGGAPGVINTNHAIRERLRVHGAHLSVPEMVAPAAPAVVDLNRENSVPGQTTILDLYRERLANGGSVDVATDFYKIVPWELRHGSKFDLNRWLGDGFDSTTPVDNVGDDTTEAFSDPAHPAPNNVAPFNGPRETAWLTGGGVPTGFTGINAEHVNGVDANNDGLSADTPITMTFTAAMKAQAMAADRVMARHLYCRHLFCLAMLFFDNTGFLPDPQAFPHEPGVSAADRRELFIRRIAQWAVNVVDFRDSDAIMTAFEYDKNPWNGWSVDGVVGTSDDTITDRRLVWGAEYPDLLITESLFFHDRRVRDTDNDSTAADREETTDPDDDVDQYRRPEGSGYIELYNPRAYLWSAAPYSQTANQKPRLPRELYNAAGQLELGKLAPGGWPVWRIAITELSYNNSNGDFPDSIKPNEMASPDPMSTNSRRESASFEAAAGAEPARDVSLLAGTWTNQAPSPMTPVVPIERFVWFNSAANLAATVGANAPFDTASFYNDPAHNGNPLLEPGQYAIIGPRPLTYLGSHNPMTVMPPVVPPEEQMWGGYSLQTITLDATGATITDTDGNPTTRVPLPAMGAEIRNAISIVANVTGTPTFNAVPWANPTTIGLNVSEPLYTDYYGEPNPLPAPPMGFPLDIYDNPQTPMGTFPDEPYDSRMGFPLADNSMTQTGTYVDCASIYLQRLANPLLPFNTASNPYLTVDWAAIDLTVFTGEENTDRTVDNEDGMDQDVDPSDPPNPGRPDMKWATRQRGLQAPAAPDANPWPVWTQAPNDNGAATGPASLFFRPSLDNTQHTLPFLNDTWGTPRNSMDGYIGEVNETINPMNLRTFPWLAHLNRPLANPYELLLVSSSSPSRQTSEFSPGFSFGPAVPTSLYNGTPGQEQNLRAPFGYLLNFFHSDAATTNSPQLHRLLDYVEVPSPYAGAERWYNPTNFGSAGLYRPPFNKLSRFRDAGRININTIFDSEVWNSAISQFPGMNTVAFVDKVSRSRRGFGGLSPLAQTDGSNPVPTLFGNPFRTSDAADLMPDPFGPLSMRQPSPVNATFLRPDTDAPANGNLPLFDRQATGGTDIHHNTNRNAYFRYQALQKLGNTFTTHSNVFAVWMTVGYFEVEDNLDATNVVVINAAHPDGLRLGPEIGADSGEITRHRSFFIIDRSVPVGYSHGQKLNTDNCVLLRRQIE